MTSPEPQSFSYLVDAFSRLQQILIATGHDQEDVITDADHLLVVLRDRHHMIDIDRDGWVIQHPICERLAGPDALLRCEYTKAWTKRLSDDFDYWGTLPGTYELTETGNLVL
jgi:hypothetical protein